MQVSKALTALVAKYGSLDDAVAEGWQFVDEVGRQVSENKTSGPHYLLAPGTSGPDFVLSSGKALDAIMAAPEP